jgi:AraC family transcriptional regulator
MCWKVDGHWCREVVQTGECSLVPRTAQSYWRWNANLRQTLVYLSEKSVLTIASQIFDRDVVSVPLRGALKATDSLLLGAIFALSQEAENRNIGSQIYIDGIKL